MAASMEELEILRDAEALADGVWELVGGWDAFQRETVGMQVVRSADSVGANIAKACGRYHYGEKLRFLYFARGSLFEMKYWLNRLKSRQLTDSDIVQQYATSLNHLVRRLNSFIAYVKKLQRTNGDIREPIPTYNADSENDLTPAEKAFLNP